MEILECAGKHFRNALVEGHRAMKNLLVRSLAGVLAACSPSADVSVGDARSGGGTAAIVAPTTVKNIVLVHGMGFDGSIWRPVYERLSAAGYRVNLVQLPLTGFDQDVAATERVIAMQDGPVLLVGHSYGGVVITTAGNDPIVGGLVYVAAIQPDVGETMGSLNARTPSQFPQDASIVENGFTTFSQRAFRNFIAQDLPPSDADYLYASQSPTSIDVYTAPTIEAAWRTKQATGIVASKDRTVNPELEREMYSRASGDIYELDGSHMLMLSHPDEVARIIANAAQRLAETRQQDPQ